MPTANRHRQARRERDLAGQDAWFGFVGVTPNYVGHDPDAPLVEQRPGQAIRRLQNSGLVTNTLANKKRSSSYLTRTGPSPYSSPYGGRRRTTRCMAR